MTTIFDMLSRAEGAQFVCDCWGEMPEFKFIEILHLKHRTLSGVADVTILAVLATYESDDLNQCKPSKMSIRFCDVSHFEFMDAFGDHPAHGVKLDAIFTSLATGGILAIDTRDGFYIGCRRVQVLSCIRDPLTGFNFESSNPSNPL